MTRLVVVAGTHATDWDATRQQLVSWRTPLAGLGVRLSPADESESWTAVARELAAGKAAQDLLEAMRGAVQDGADALVVGSDQLEDPLRDPATVGNLEALASELEMPITVLVVLRDQLSYLNEIYCDRVSALQMARSFTAFAAEPQPIERFDYATALQPFLRSDAVTLTAVPYSGMQDRTQAREIVRALGLADEAVDALPAGVGRRRLPGPIAIAAHRLLFKRAWRLGVMKTVPRGRVLGAGRLLRQYAAQQRWDETEFWGWTSDDHEEARARYQPGNDAVATELWGRPWGDDWERHAYAEADLATCSPPVVVDVLGTVDTIVKDLQKVKGAAPPGATTD